MELGRHIYADIPRDKSELVVSAGGKSSRLRPYLDTHEVGMPKHLLPLPGSHEFLLKAIINNASKKFYSIRVSASEENIHHLESQFTDEERVLFEVDGLQTGPLGPMIRSVIETRAKSYGCAGDFFCEFSWEEFDSFHESHDMPVSILVAKSRPTNDGARFSLDRINRITSWERVERTTDHDLINIGAYIIDADSALIDELAEMTYHKEDVFNDLLIPHGLMAGYNPGSEGFNVNTVEIYHQLCEYLSTQE